MENNELEEMRAQLATLNEKLENESIVDERLVNEATKKHISELQRKLIGRIVIFSVLAPFLYYFLGLYFGLWCLGIAILSIYVYRMTHKTISASMTMTEYDQRIRKALKTYKKANRRKHYALCCPIPNTWQFCKLFNKFFNFRIHRDFIVVSILLFSNSFCKHFNATTNASS